MSDFPTKSCNLATYARHASIMLLAASLMACATSNNDGLAYTADRGIDNQPYPNQYRSELLAFLKVYLNDPRGVREAAIAPPIQSNVGGRQRYVICLRYNARGADGSYSGAKARAVLFVDGRLDRMIDDVGDICAGATYAVFPEMEQLTR